MIQVTDGGVAGRRSDEIDPKLAAFVAALARADVACQLRLHAERVVADSGQSDQAVADPEARPRDYLHL